MDVRLVNYGLIRNPRTLKASECLRRLYQGIQESLQEYQPDHVAIEGIFYCRNIRTAISLGQARGVVIAACGDCPVHEYSPRSVKQAVTGSGRAHKQQVGHMMMNLLKMKSTPPEDAADALAIAYAHAAMIARPGVNSPTVL